MLRHTMILVLIFISLIGEKFLVKAMTEEWCDKDSTDCYFDIKIDYGLTMMHGKTLVQVKNGRLYRYNAKTFTSATEVSADDVIVADGHPEPKFVMTFNGKIPGPAYHVYEGQTVHLRVTNKMQHESTTVHIHGLYQRGTAYSDGVPFVTQCPIFPGQTFTQIFLAEPKGTFFYHGHSGPQVSNGLYGAFIVHSKTPDTFDISKLDPTKSGMDDKMVTPAKEHILFFQDYNHDWDANMVTMKMRFGQYKEGGKIPSTKNLADINYSLFDYQAGLINGRGRYDYEASCTPESKAPLSVFTVTRNTFQRFRLLNSGSIHPFRVSIESHKLLVVSSDGYDIDPILVDSVIMNPGERFDIIIQTNQAVRNYWIYGQTLQTGFINKAEAVLHYEGSPQNEDPTSDYTDPYLQFAPTTVLNCPFSNYPETSSTTCLNFDKIKSRNPNPDSSTKGDGFQEFFLNFAFPGTSSTPGSVNGRAFESPAISLFTQPNDDYQSCDKEDCGNDRICYCPLTLDIKPNVIVQLVFSNIGTGKGWDHPVHLHGHGFQLIRLAYPSYNRTTGKFIEQTTDISCNGDFCNNATWSDASWKNGNLPDIDVTNAPTKDNLIVPSGGYAVVRFKADNPGLWMVHCHLGLHLHDGMAALISEDKENWPETPYGFPQCNNYVPNDNK